MGVTTVSYRLERKESVRDGVRRIAREQIDKALDELADEKVDRHETVHQVRKRFKKIRGLLRLVRTGMEETYQRENAWYRDQAREFSHVRDAESLIETLEALQKRFQDPLNDEPFAVVRDWLEERRRRIADEQLDLEERLAALAGRLADARERVGDWELDGRDWDCVRAGVKKTYKRARRAAERARKGRDDETLHEWRKRVKYHWYHMRLLRDAWKPVLKARVDAADELADLLGHDHDLAVFQHTLASASSNFGETAEPAALLGLAHRRRAELQAEAFRLGPRLLAESPAAFVQRLGTYWKTWRRESATKPAAAS